MRTNMRTNNHPLITPNEDKRWAITKAIIPQRRGDIYCAVLNHLQEKDIITQFTTGYLRGLNCTTLGLPNTLNANKYISEMVAAILNGGDSGLEESGSIESYKLYNDIVQLQPYLKFNDIRNGDNPFGLSHPALKDNSTEVKACVDHVNLFFLGKSTQRNPEPFKNKYTSEEQQTICFNLIRLIGRFFNSAREENEQVAKSPHGHIRRYYQFKVELLNRLTEIDNLIQDPAQKVNCFKILFEINMTTEESNVSYGLVIGALNRIKSHDQGTFATLLSRFVNKLTNISNITLTTKEERDLKQFLNDNKDSMDKDDQKTIAAFRYFVRQSANSCLKDGGLF